MRPLISLLSVHNGFRSTKRKSTMQSVGWNRLTKQQWESVNLLGSKLPKWSPSWCRQTWSPVVPMICFHGPWILERPVAKFRCNWRYFLHWTCLLLHVRPLYMHVVSVCQDNKVTSDYRNKTQDFYCQKHHASSFLLDRRTPVCFRSLWQRRQYVTSGNFLWGDSQKAAIHSTPIA